MHYKPQLSTNHHQTLLRNNNNNKNHTFMYDHQQQQTERPSANSFQSIELSERQVPVYFSMKAQKK